MELRQARYFLAVVEAGTISSAAEQIGIVQSAVSQQIARLERELGVALFDRSRRSVHLTPAGADFVPAARALVDAEEAARRSVTGRRAGRVVRVGITGGLDARLYRALQQLRDALPSAVVETVAVPPAERLTRVADGRLDVAVLHGEHVHPGVTSTVVARDRLSVVTATDHPLADAQPDLAALAPYPLVLQEGAVGTAVAAVVVAACRAAGFEPRLEVHSGSGPFASLAATDGAWSVFYADQARLLDGDTLGLRFHAIDEPELAVALSVAGTVSARSIARRFARALAGAAAPG